MTLRLSRPTLPEEHPTQGVPLASGVHPAPGMHRAGGVHRAADIASRARAVLAVVALTLTGLVVGLAPSAAAATVTATLESATQSADGTLDVRGWAVDRRNPSASTSVTIWVDGHRLRPVAAGLDRPDVDRVHHLTGRHGFRLLIHLSGPAHRIDVRTHDRANAVLATGAVRQLGDAGTRIVAVARRYVGARYVEGGASPRGFDCSGYTQYAYAQAHVAALPHNAEAQRRLARSISRAQARPGDLVFYLSGGSAYHVAIYAGNGRQYAAATPRDGVRYQPIWSSAVSFGTTWH